MGIQQLFPAWSASTGIPTRHCEGGRYVMISSKRCFGEGLMTEEVLRARGLRGPISQRHGCEKSTDAGIAVFSPC